MGSDSKLGEPLVYGQWLKKSERSADYRFLNNHDPMLSTEPLLQCLNKDQ